MPKIWGSPRGEEMKNSIGIMLILLCVGCAQVPQWDTIERQTAEAELENSMTQLEMNGAAGGLASLAEKRLAAALDYKLSVLSKSERIKLLMEQAEWQRLMDRRNQESMGDGSIAPMMQSQREESRLKNRFIELTVPKEVRQAFIAMRNAPVHFQRKVISLKHGELDFTIPDEKWEDGRPKFDTIAQLNIPFCRKMVIGKDTFHIGIIEPTNYGVRSSYGLGTESNLSIWKNGTNIANYLLGKKITIQGLSINGNMIKVSFLTESEEMQQKEFDCQVPNDNPVQINHWTMEKIN